MEILIKPDNTIITTDDGQDLEYHPESIVVQIENVEGDEHYVDICDLVSIYVGGLQLPEE